MHTYMMQYSGKSTQLEQHELHNIHGGLALLADS